MRMQEVAELASARLMPRLNIKLIIHWPNMQISSAHHKSPDHIAGQIRFGFGLVNQIFIFLLFDLFDFLLRCMHVRPPCQHIMRF